MAVQNQKKKLLAVMEILLQRTDENHTMSAQDICSVLENQYDIVAERKGIYADIAALQEMGLDIIQNKGSASGYYIGSRKFELAELKLLVDAVQASRFIPGKRSEELIKKLESLTSMHRAQLLQRNVYIYNRAKTENKNVLISVDGIHEAISNNCQIQFKYAEWTPKKELRFRKNGEYYIVSPWALAWEDENYYLVAYDADADLVKYFRVDRMKSLSVRKENRLGKENFRKFDLAALAKKTFGMYSGEDERVSLLCENRFAGVIIDRFGKEVSIIPSDADHFKATFLVSVSEQFFGWVTGLGEDVQIVGPSHVQERYTEYLKRILEQYRGEQI